MLGQGAPAVECDRVRTIGDAFWSCGRPIAMLYTRDEKVAMHEAAHAVVAIRMGGIVYWIDKTPSTVAGIHSEAATNWTTPDGQIQDAYAVIAAGRALELMLEADGQLERDGTVQDRAIMVERFPDSTPEDFEDAARRVRNLLTEDSMITAMEYVTQAYLAEGSTRVNGKHLHALVDPLLYPEGRSADDKAQEIINSLPE